MTDEDEEPEQPIIMNAQQAPTNETHLQIEPVGVNSEKTAGKRPYQSAVPASSSYKRRALRASGAPVELS